MTFLLTAYDSVSFYLRLAKWILSEKTDVFALAKPKSIVQPNCFRFRGPPAFKPYLKEGEVIPAIFAM